MSQCQNPDCGKQLESKRKSKKYCNANCRQAAFRNANSVRCNANQQKDVTLTCPDLYQDPKGFLVYWGQPVPQHWAGLVPIERIKRARTVAKDLGLTNDVEI